jgi:hypothetical protein
MRLAVRVTLNFNNNMSTAAVFLDIEKAFDTTWHSGLLHELPELEFSTSLIKLIAYFLTDRKFNVLVEGEYSTQIKKWWQELLRVPSLPQYFTVYI